MSNPDNTTDKDFVMSDSDTNEDVSDRYENKTVMVYPSNSCAPITNLIQMQKFTPDRNSN